MRVGVVALSGLVPVEALEAGLKTLEGWGHELILADNLRAVEGFKAGSAQQRLAALNGVLDQNPEVLWFARGGSGIMDLLPAMEPLDLGTVHTLVGYSDVTPFFPLVKKHNPEVRCLHGPMVVDLSDPERFDAESLRAALDGLPAPFSGHRLDSAPGTEPASGMVRGGCLSMVCAQMGTPFELEPDGTLFFFEEVGEPLYRLDRMIRQLELAGWPDRVRALLLGQFSRCFDREEKLGPQLMISWLRERLLDWRVPILGGLPVGHGLNKATLPLEVEASLQGEKLGFS